MKYLKTWLIWKLCFLIALPLNSWSQAQPVAQPANVNRAVSGVLQDGMRARGFAMNDPRYGNTVARISPQLSTVAGTAAAVTVGAVTAPGWASAALAVGVGAVITYAVTLGLDAIINWLFRIDGRLDVGSDPTDPVVTCTMTGGGFYWAASSLAGGAVKTFAGCDGGAVARENYKNYVSDKPSLPREPASFFVDTNSISAGGQIAFYKLSGAPANCGPGQVWDGSTCTAYSYKISPVPSQSAVTPQVAVNSIPAADLDKKLNPAIVAGLANSAWQRAASQPGYDGLPYPQNNPINPTEVTTWTNANPQYTPTVRDFVSPNPVTPANPQPWALPSNPTATTTTPAVTPNANTVNPAAANPLQNLGPEPGTGAPQLEPTPTAQQILQPKFDLLPNLRNFSAATHTGVCPKPSVSIVGTSVTMSAHCTLIDDNKAVMQAAMAFAWAAFALFIVLSA